MSQYRAASELDTVVFRLRDSLSPICNAPGAGQRGTVGVTPKCDRLWRVRLDTS